MTYLAIIFASLAICFLIVKFGKYSAAVFLTLVAGIIIGVLVMPINLTVGLYISVYSFLFIILFWILFAVSGFISLIVVTPILLLLGAIGLIKKD